MEHSEQIQEKVKKQALGLIEVFHKDGCTEWEALRALMFTAVQIAGAASMSEQRFEGILNQTIGIYKENHAELMKIFNEQRAKE